MISSPEIVSIIVKSDQLFCTWLHHSKKDALSFCLNAYEMYQSDCLFTTKSSLINSTYVVDCIRNFLQKYSLKNPYILLGLSSEALYENYYWIEQESTAMNSVQSENKLLVWNYCVLDHTNDSKDTLLYVFGLSRSQILQYQLAALRTPFNCIFITSVQCALLQLLWSVRGKKSSAEVVTGKMLDFRHRLKSLIEFLEFKTDAVYAEHEIEALCASMGLYILGENYESL